MCADELYEVILIVWPYDLPQAALKPAVLWGEELIAALRNDGWHACLFQVRQESFKK